MKTGNLKTTQSPRNALGRLGQQADGPYTTASAPPTALPAGPLLSVTCERVGESLRRVITLTDEVRGIADSIVGNTSSESEVIQDEPIPAGRANAANRGLEVLDLALDQLQMQVNRLHAA